MSEAIKKNEENKKNINEKEDKQSNKKKDEQKDDKKKNKHVSFNSNRKKKMKVSINNQKEEEKSYYYNKRSYSCKINEEIRQEFNYTDEEIKINLNEKFKFLKTPQLKPKKSGRIPNPINIGSISISNKKSKYKMNNENIILTEGEDEQSNEFSSDSNSELYEEREIEEFPNNLIISQEIENKENNNYNSNEVKEFQIQEENDEFNEKGNLVLKNLRKNMIQSKKDALRNSKNNKKYENILSEKYKKIKENILSIDNNEEENLTRLFHKTIGFSIHNNLPILEFLRRNSTHISSKKFKKNKNCL